MSILSDHQQQTAAPVGTGHPVLPRVNLLPPEIAEKAQLKKVQAGLGVGLLAAVGVVGVLFMSAAGSVSDANTELETATAATATLNAEKAKFADVQAVYARAAAAQAMLTQAMGEEVRYSQYLNDLSLTVPDNVWLTELTFDQTAVAAGVGQTEPGVGTVSFSGIGLKHDDVAAWLDSLAKQKGYTNPYFTSSTKAFIGARSTVGFKSTVTMTPASLSGRYTKPAGG